MSRSRSRPFRVLTAFAVLALVAGCDRSEERLIAREIHGTWVAPAGSHEDRGFTITEDSIYLLQSGGIVAGHRIEEVARLQRPDHAAYTVRYRGATDAPELRFGYYATQGEPYIQIRNQRESIWRRVSS
jgi:hypothetical protein